MKGLLIAGGYGTRLRPWTLASNKHLLPVANRPMILYALDRLREARINDIAVVLGPVADGITHEKDRALQRLLGDGSRYDARIHYIWQQAPKGLAYAVKAAQQFVGDAPFIALLADNFSEEKLQPFIEEFQTKNLDGLLAVKRVKKPSGYGVAEARGHRLKRLVEKPSRPKSNLVLTGTYILDPAIFDAIRKARPSRTGELELTDTLQVLIDRGRSVGVRGVSGWWGDMGTPEGLLEANKHVLMRLQPHRDGKLSRLTRVSGTVSVGARTTTEGNANLIGPSIIGKGCVIGPESIVGPYASIGDGSIVRGARVRNSIIMRGCRVEGSANVSDSVVGSDSTLSFDAPLSRRSRLMVGNSTSIFVE